MTEEQIPQKNSKKKSGGFQSFNLIYPVYKAIQQKGYNVPTPIQRKAIPLIMEGKDVVACSRTGSGKTAAFIIPLLNKLKSHSKIVGTRALILLPTRELALQTASVLKTFIRFTDLTYSLIVGGHGYEGQFESLASNPDIIIATPGRLMQHLVETNLSLLKVEYLVFDEADYFFEMGFQDQLKQILHKVTSQRQTLLFSATISEEVSSFVRMGLKDYIFVKLDSEYQLSENLNVNFLLVKSDEKIASLIYILTNVIKPDETAIVFAATRYHVELYEEILKAFGVNCVGVFGKMDQFSRKEQIMKFKDRLCNVLIVTDLAARGIDIPFVTHIVNADYPTHAKLFIHRCGRTARAGKSGSVYTFITKSELMYLAEVQLYIGRKLSSSLEDNLNDTTMAFYGGIPYDCISLYQETYKALLRENLDLQSKLQTSKNAYQQFRKTRTSASKASLKACKQIDITVTHPMFKELITQQQGASELYDKIRNFKPKMSYLEIKKKKTSPEEFQQYQQILQNFKKKLLETDIAKTLSTKKKVQRNFLDDYDEPIQQQNDQNDSENSINELDINDEFQQEDLEQNGQQDIEIDDQEDQYLEFEEEEAETENQQTETKLISKRKANSQVNEEYVVNNQKTSKKLKKSQIMDFRDNKYFISEEAPKDRVTNEFNKEGMISVNDLNPYIMAEDNEDLQKQRQKKSFKWSQARKKYVGVNIGADGKVIKRDSEDKKVGRDKGKKKFQEWSQRNYIRYQKEGELEDDNIANRAKRMFKERTKSQHLMMSDKENKRNYGGSKKKSNSNMKSGPKPKGELKNKEQIIKMKQKSKNLSLKNMPKDKRRQIETKIKNKSSSGKGRGSMVGKGSMGGKSSRGGKSSKGGKASKGGKSSKMSKGNKKR